MINLIVPKSFEIAGVEFYLYGLVIGLAVALYIYLLERDVKSDFSFNEILCVLLGVLLGARLLHVLNELDYYSQDLARVLELGNGGGSFFGGILGAFAAILIISKIRNYNLLSNLDRFALYLPIAHAVGRIGNFINQELYGKPTELIWGIFIEPQNRIAKYKEFEYFHPAFAYEAILNLILFAMLRYVDNKSQANGKILATYLIGYGTIRIALMSIRIDRGYFMGIETAYLAAIAFILTGVLLLWRNYKL